MTTEYGIPVVDRIHIAARSPQRLVHGSDRDKIDATSVGTYPATDIQAREFLVKVSAAAADSREIRATRPVTHPRRVVCKVVNPKD